MEKRKSKWGDRWDGYRLRGLDPVHVMMPYMFGKRTENEAVLGEVIDLTELDKYLAAKNAQNPEFKYTWFHFIAAALAKAVLLRPKMNYFIAGGHYYERKKIQVAFNVKRRFTDEGEEAMAKFVLDPEGESPLEQVHSYVQKFVTKVRSDKEGVGVDDILKILSYLPRPLFRLLTWTLKKMEYYGIYPKSLAADDPCYSSVYISNLGSIKMNADYHHLFNWGTISFFVVIGEKKMRPYYKEDGSYELRNSLKLGLTVDERIADGYYFAKTLRLVRKMFAHPELLDLPAATPIDIE
ncbi:MAG: 2-oxo acid dehydrogenase subunit E2 [Bacteroidales bacterium]|nr:2-oxo acid dehydrogenase subunit E2 [Bacteroidales bacterium]MCR5276043.1 2-oxo acid dehydrogenase subunit E2 [Bacteroidales bacterium]